MQKVMWRLASSIMLAAVVCAFMTPATASAVQDERATIKTEANLRARADTTSDIRAVLPEGTEVTVVCWTEGEPTYGTDRSGSMWLYLARGGWVHSVLVTPVDVPPCSTDTSVLFDNCDDA